MTALESDRRQSPRVLICTADVGCGHGRAANALTLALRAAQPGMEVRQIDALELAPRSFNRLYRDLYLAAAKRLPSLTGWLYRRTDYPGPATGGGLGLAIEAWALQVMRDDERVQNADIIVCTHFLCARVLSRLRGRGELNAPLAVVVTDQHPHAIWRVRHADLFLVASEDAAAEMLRQGIASSRVRVTGIPIDARFDHPTPRDIARRRHDIAQDARVALITGGGLGLGGLDRALDGVLSTSTDVTCVVVCGRNESLHRQLITRFGTQSKRVRLFGLTQRMHELMAAADVMIGKAGGLTTSEATAIGLPMVLLRPLPGQEEYNAAALLRAGAAVLHRDPFAAGEATAHIFESPDRLQQLRANSLAFGRRASAAAAANAVLELLPEQSSAEATPHPHRHAVAV